MGSGYFFGFQHRYNDGSVPQTTFKIGVEFYKRADWDWLSVDAASVDVPAFSDATFNATAVIPTTKKLCCKIRAQLFLIHITFCPISPL